MFLSLSMEGTWIKVPFMDRMGLTTIHLCVDRDPDSRAKQAVQIKKVMKVRTLLLLSMTNRNEVTD